MAYSAAQALWEISFEVSPIILTGGIATALGGYLPIVALTEGGNIFAALLSGSGTGITDPNNVFAKYKPLPGATLLKNDISRYPFANQTVAANAVIAQPNTISFLMQCPANPSSGGYPLKLTTMMALQATLKQHSLSGGLYTLLTAGGIYPNCILTQMADVSGGESNQQQYQWQLDFEAPLVTLQAAQAAQNIIMQAITNQVPGGASLAPLAGTALAIGSPVGFLASTLTPATIQ